MDNKIMLFCLIIIVIVPFVYAPDTSIAECKYSAKHSDGETAIYALDGKDFKIFTHIEAEDNWASFKVNGEFGEKTSQFSEQWGNPLLEGETITISGLKIIVTDIGRVEGGTEEYVSFCYDLPQEPEPVSECPTGCICEGNIIECPTEEELCTDSDGGKNYYVKGYVIAGGVTHYDQCGIREYLTWGKLFEKDSCKDEEGCVLMELSCPSSSASSWASTDYKCPNGCKDGACVLQTPQLACAMPICINNQQPEFTGKYDANGCKIYQCPAIPSFDVYLNQKFNLKNGQTAIVKDYKNMKIRYIAESTCACIEGQECPPCEKEIFLQVEMPGDCKKNSGNVVEECTNQAIEFSIKVGEIKKVFGAEIKLLNLYNSIATLLVTKETSPPGGIYVKLGEKFTLAEGGSAKVTDYNYMKIILNKIFGNTVSVQVEIPSVCEDETCTEGIGTEFDLKQGESKEVFGARLTLLGLIKETLTWKVYATFIVEKSLAEGGVDVEIIPSQQTITYGEKAIYKVRVTDKHPIPECPVGAQCKPTAPLTYQIYIKNLPFLKEYPKEISITHGSSTSFELIVKPYELIEPVAVEEEPEIAITGKTVETPTVKKVISKPVKRIEKIEIAEQIGTGTIVSTSAEISKEDTSTEPVQIALPSNLIKKYKFSVTAILKDNSKIQDTANAVLLIKPLSPTPPPPEFPGEKVSIKLYKGWNLISLPGKLIKFDKSGLRKNQKLIGFVYIKEKQKYLSLKEAEEILGDQLKDYLAKNAFWIYSRNPMTLNVWVDREISFDLGLVKGWNLVPITEDMLGGYLTDILGDCELDKIYLWNAENQKWNKIDLNYSFSDYQLGYGFLVKAKDYCKFIGLEIIAPPPMPE